MSTQTSKLDPNILAIVPCPNIVMAIVSLCMNETTLHYSALLLLPVHCKLFGSKNINNIR